MLSKETLEFLKTVLDSMTLTVAAPDFNEVATNVIRARSEINEALENSVKEVK